MAIKIFCDSCQKEITGNQEFGNLKIQEKTIGWLKHQKQDQLRVREFIFCIECVKKLLEKKENGGDTK